MSPLGSGPSESFCCLPLVRVSASFCARSVHTTDNPDVRGAGTPVSFGVSSDVLPVCCASTTLVAIAVSFSAAPSTSICTTLYSDTPGLSTPSTISEPFEAVTNSRAGRSAW